MKIWGFTVVYEMLSKCQCCHTAYHLGPAPGSLGALKEMRVNNENSSEKTWKTVI